MNDCAKRGSKREEKIRLIENSKRRRCETRQRHCNPTFHSMRLKPVLGSGDHSRNVEASTHRAVVTATLLQLHLSPIRLSIHGRVGLNACPAWAASLLKLTISECLTVVQSQPCKPGCGRQQRSLARTLAKLLWSWQY